MANREALRELQTRLAERLQAAQTESRRSACLAVECAGHGLLFPLAGAGEIFSVPTLLPVPHTRPGSPAWPTCAAACTASSTWPPSWACATPRPAGEPLREGARLLALNAALGSHCALLVDRLAGLRSEDQLTAVASAGADAARPAFAGARWRDEAGRELAGNRPGRTGQAPPVSRHRRLNRAARRPFIEPTRST